MPNVKIPKIVIYPYNNYSKGARKLCEAFGHTRIKRELLLADFDSNPEPWKERTVINWGATMCSFSNSRIINHPSKVQVCSNKYKAFEALRDGGVRTPIFTEDFAEAMEWIKNGIVVMGRELKGSGGSGIRFSDEELEAVADSAFWVQYKKKKEEYRVHVIGDNVVLVQQKCLRTTDPETGEKIDTSNVDFRVRNLRNGFIFKRYDIDPPQDVLDQARKAITVVGLDFGAVDVIWNSYEKKAYVLEINTAPGLEGTSVQDYKAGFDKLLGG